jgi:hypothetical protein
MATEDAFRLTRSGHTTVAASVCDQNKFVTVFSPERDAFITMELAVFDLMVEAVNNAREDR